MISQFLENLKIIIGPWGNKMKLTTSCNLSALWACLPLSAALYAPFGLVHAVHAALVPFGYLFVEKIKDCNHREPCGIIFKFLLSQKRNIVGVGGADGGWAFIEKLPESHQKWRACHFSRLSLHIRYG